MSRHPIEENSFYSLLRFAFGFVEAIFSGAWLVLRAIFQKDAQKPLRKSHFLESLHYFAHDWPKNFWKFPTGIGIGRGVGAMISFIFKKTTSFESKKPNSRGFTLIEMIVSLTLFGVLMVMAFAVMGNIWVSRNLVEWRIDINEQLYSASEQLASTIKQWGDIDYEEYFNRTVVGLTLSGGHYAAPTGFGNYGNGWTIATNLFGATAYACRSDVGVDMGTNGCFTAASLNSQTANQSGTPQRFGQYKTQFVDRNSDRNNDTTVCAAKWTAGMPIGDTNCDGNIVGDDDDEDLGAGPEAFSGSTGQAELYLIKRTDKGLERLILRRRVELDPFAPAGYTCNTTTAVGNGCIGRLEMLRLIGSDVWYDHEWITSGNPAGRFDGRVDTWECHPDFNCANMIIGSITRKIPTGADSEWVSLFEPDVDVRSIKFFPAPSKDFRLAWKEANANFSISSYVRFSTTLGFGWERRRKIKIQNPEVTIATTVTLDN